MMAGVIIRKLLNGNRDKGDNMKKYGVYAAIEVGMNNAFLIREYCELKRAVKEAYRLSRFRYQDKKANFTTTFIVGNNTGISLNMLSFHEYIRYSVVKCMEVRWLEISGGQNAYQNAFLVKVGD